MIFRNPSNVSQSFQYFTISGSQHNPILCLWPCCSLQALFIPRTQGKPGFSGLKNTAGGWAALQCLQTVCLCTSRKLYQFPLWRCSLRFFFLFALQSFSKRLFNLENQLFMQVSITEALVNIVFNYWELSPLLKDISTSVVEGTESYLFFIFYIYHILHVIMAWTANIPLM